MSMRGRQDPIFERLLSGRDRPSITEKERALAQLLDGVEQDKRRRGARWFGVPRWVLGAAAAAAAVAIPCALLVLRRPERGEWVARGAGGSGAATASMVLSCSRGAPATSCPVGAKLYFRLHVPQGGRFFAAVAVGAQGTAIWYFPGAGAGRAGSADLAGLPASGVLEQAIVLGGEHAPGDYEVHGLFSERPLARPDVRAVLESRPGSARLCVAEVRAHLRVGLP
jgi:hypothetical protein